MRVAIAFFLVAISLAGKNKYLTYKELQTETEKTIDAIKKLNKTSPQKELSKLKLIFESSIKEYKIAFPKKGPKEELDVLMLYYSIEPVFSLVENKITEESCAQKRHQIELEDGRTTDGKASVYAQPALELLGLICPNKIE